uniref:Uncharacterized protein n=1 Tax=Plectus sambesii TaxID=2011161 RepID=A0A914UUE4_9BILA
MVREAPLLIRQLTAAFLAVLVRFPLIGLLKSVGAQPFVNTSMLIGNDTADSVDFDSVLSRNHTLL